MVGAEHAEDLQQVLGYEVVAHDPGRLRPLQRAGGGREEARALLGR